MANDPILDLAMRFAPVAPPPTYEGRLEFLAYYVSQASQVIDLLPEPENFDVSTVLNDMSSMRSMVERAAKTFIPGTQIIKGIEFSGSLARNFLIGAFIVATSGATVHMPMMRSAVLGKGLITPEELNADYFRRLNLLQAIVAIGKSGALDPLFEAEAQRRGLQGTHRSLGAAPPLWAIAVLVVVAVAVLAALAYAVVQIVNVTQTNRLIDKYVDKLCFDAYGNPIPAVQGECVKLLKDLRENGGVGTGQKPILDQIVMYGAIGVGVYAFVALLPNIVRSVKEARKVSRE